MPTSDQPSQQPLRLADRLAAAQRRAFVGRQVEVETFRRALLAPEPPFAVLHIYGPGGVGKTTLLNEYRHIAAEAGVPVIRIDGRNVERSPPGFLRALGQQMGLAEDASPLDALSAMTRGVLLIDTWEALPVLDGWLRETLLPQLSSGMLVVIAGRNQPADEWRTTPGWAQLVRVVSLRNLRPEESQTYLNARRIPEAHHEAVLSFTHGHPLALSLVADVLGQGDDLDTFSPEQEPDILRVLLERFVRQIPDARHRQALEVCAHVRVTTEDLLAEALATESAHDLFEWLRGLSFIEEGLAGLFPHDLARDVLDLDLRWRNPERYRQLHRSVRAPIVRRFGAAQGIEQQRAFFDLLFLHRHNPVMKRQFDWASLGAIYAEPASAPDYDGILTMVEHHEGVDSARIAAHWLMHQPQAFTALRDAHGELAGFVCTVALHVATPDDLEVDPAAQAAWNYARAHGPIRGGEEMLYYRFTMARDTYQQPSAVMDMVAPICAAHWLTNHRLAWTFLATSDPEIWDPMFTHLNQLRAEDAGFTVGERSYAVYVHDWRVQSGAAWLEMMGTRELDTEPGTRPAEAAPATPLVVLSQPEFEAAVRQALRDFTRPDALATNPLMRSRLVADVAGSNPDPAALQALLRDAAATLEVHPRDARLYRAIHHTYFQPAPTQERAAELLDLPFSTYRYHLNAALKRITTWLWQREINGPEG